MSTPLTATIQRYFWGDDIDTLSWEKHQNYIIQTLLEKGDTPAISWLFKQVDKAQLKQLLPTFKLSYKSKNFWNLYLS